MKHESERKYVAHNESIDDAAAWANGSMYGVGLGDDMIGTDAIMAVTPSGAGTSWADAFKSSLPVLTSMYQQRQLTRLNIARINRNQAPYSAEEYGRVYQPPSAQVQFGATSDTKRLMLYAAIGLAALVGLRAAKVI